MSTGFRASIPGAAVELEYMHPNQVYERVLSDQADLGLISFANPGRELTAIPWRREPMVVACLPSHRLAQRPASPKTGVNPAEVAGERFVAFDRGAHHPSGDGPVPATARCRGRHCGRVRQHRDDQAGRRGRRGDRGTSRADPAARNRERDAARGAFCRDLRGGGIRAAPGHHSPAEASAESGSDGIHEAAMSG